MCVCDCAGAGSLKFRFRENVDLLPRFRLTVDVPSKKNKLFPLFFEDHAKLNEIGERNVAEAGDAAKPLDTVVSALKRWERDETISGNIMGHAPDSAYGGTYACPIRRM